MKVVVARGCPPPTQAHTRPTQHPLLFSTQAALREVREEGPWVFSPGEASESGVRPEEGEGPAAAAEIRLRLLQPRLHGDKAPDPALAQGDAVGDADLQGLSYPEEGRERIGVSGRGGRAELRRPAALPEPWTHSWQCTTSTPTNSPTRLSSGGRERCRHTTRSSWPRACSTTSWSRPLVTLSPVT